MNKPFLLSAVMVLAAGGIVFVQQTGRLQEILNASAARRPVGTAPAAHAPASRTWAPPPEKRPEPEGRLLDRLAVKLVESLGPDQLALFLEAADPVETGRIGIAAELTVEERKIFADKYAFFRHEQAALIKRPDLTGAARDAAWTALVEQRSAWTKSQLGPERAAKVEEARKVALRAAAEHDAAGLVSRIGGAADLSTTQKDRLYATLLERSQNAPPPVSSPGGNLEFRVWGSVKEEPSTPDIADEARDVLTPEQWAVYDQNRRLGARQQETMMDALKGMAPAAIATLQEFLTEKPAAPATAPGNGGSP